ncbi:hypothetical protein FIBSPDRAFT_859153 [Athelia psychrophila]|uniref:Uncharacterized protein n=1 Tax=Athelia psychrophila TaxID=1759441 RepID=A0A166LGV6_9AGAM|nr:hypothetical protein FIBSPDRAFT_859153 [Fibularhizoctonia sp. CBS 109695]
MNTTSTSDILQRRTPENLILQRTASHDSRGLLSHVIPIGLLKLTCFTTYSVGVFCALPFDPIPYQP